MIKVKNNIATREDLPKFLQGLKPESLLDLSWTDSALGVSDCAWWPELDESAPLGQYERYGAETLTPDPGRQVVVVVREIVSWTEEEITQDLEARKTAKLAELAQLRFEKETGGVTVNGTVIRTDRESQAVISGAYNAMQIDPTRVIDFKGVNGWVKLDSAAVTVVSEAVADHVQACFTRERELVLALGDDINTDITTGWPI